jgi:hypothetical protein
LRQLILARCSQIDDIYCHVCFHRKFLVKQTIDASAHTIFLICFFKEQNAVGQYPRTLERGGIIHGDAVRSTELGLNLPGKSIYFSVNSSASNCRRITQVNTRVDPLTTFPKKCPELRESCAGTGKPPRPGNPYSMGCGHRPG